MKTVIPRHAWHRVAAPPPHPPACNPSVPLTQGFFLTCEGEGGRYLEQEPLHLASEQWKEPEKAEEARGGNPWGNQRLLEPSACSSINLLPTALLRPSSPPLAIFVLLPAPSLYPPQVSFPQEKENKREA